MSPPSSSVLLQEAGGESTDEEDEVRPHSTSISAGSHRQSHRQLTPFCAQEVNLAVLTEEAGGNAK